MKEAIDSTEKPSCGTKSFCEFLAHLMLSFEFRSHMVRGSIFAIQDDLRKSGALRYEISDPNFKSILESLINRLDQGPEISEDFKLSYDEAAPYLEDMTNELIICRIVNSFITYTSCLAGEIVKIYKHILKGNENITLNEVMQHDSMDSLLSYIVNQKISDLSKKGFGELEDYYEKKILTPITTDKHVRSIISLAVETRNACTHNYGYASPAFVSRIKIPGIKVGDKLEITGKFCSKVERAIFRAALDLDKRACKKYNLQIFNVA